MIRNINSSRCNSSVRIIAPVGLVIALFIQGCASTQPGTFASPDEAVEELVSAFRADDNSSLRQILGPEADEVLSSGDEIADRQRVEQFLQAFDESHALRPDDELSMTLLVGNDDWPLPIPIVQEEHTGRWWFDTEAGKDEILSRRIGQNELDVIEVCAAIVDAQSEYAIRDPNGDDVAEYARQFLSDPGAKNGLYWPVREGEVPSPLGPFIAHAVEEGYSSPNPEDEPQPYHGYFYRMLEAQGPSAPSGALDYLINGKMIGGFGVIAYPADYGNSGIMSFIVNQQGTVYQKDLGPDSAEIAKAISAFDPGEGWEPVPPQADASTSAQEQR